MNCEGCEWYRYPLLTENRFQTVQIQRVVPEMRKCERAWCDKKEEGEKVTSDALDRCRCIGNT